KISFNASSLFLLVPWCAKVPGEICRSQVAAEPSAPCLPRLHRAPTRTGPKWSTKPRSRNAHPPGRSLSPRARSCLVGSSDPRTPSSRTSPARQQASVPSPRLREHENIVQCLFPFPSSALVRKGAWGDLPKPGCRRTFDLPCQRCGQPSQARLCGFPCCKA
ncbi:MAG: hypothetical protein H6R26_3241, partial [Proteobacteria bacterium]|nr:hypothetical protein [Pseudomonadota bacterium]